MVEFKLWAHCVHQSASIRKIKFLNCKSSFTFVNPVNQEGGEENIETQTNSLRLIGYFRTSEIWRGEFTKKNKVQKVGWGSGSLKFEDGWQEGGEG